MNEAAVAAEFFADGAPKNAALGLVLRRGLHRLPRELVERHYVLQHAHRLVERAVAATQRPTSESSVHVQVQESTR